MNSLFEGVVGERIRKTIWIAGVLFAAFLAVEIVSVVSGLRYIGAGVAATNTIVVAGHGEALAVPDIATFTFSVVSDKATVADAQADATTKANALTAYLKAAGVDEKDIKTSDYSLSPQYDYQSAVCPAAGAGGAATYCPPGRQVLRGYEVRQTTTVKVRDTKKAGDLLAGVGSKGATEVSGLTFTFDNPDAVQTQARDAAITEARQKAEALAHALGVSLVRVVSFTENGSNPNPGPMVYSMGAAMSTKAAAPDISVGQNKITDDVSVTYEIR